MIFIMESLLLQLVGVFIGDTEFTPAELQHSITSRVLNKPVVTITLSSGNVEVREGKNEVE